MSRLILVVAVLGGCCVVISGRPAFGQQAADPSAPGGARPRTSAGSPTREGSGHPGGPSSGPVAPGGRAPDAAAAPPWGSYPSRSGGSSLFRSSVAAAADTPADATRATLRATSPFAVAEQEPKLVRKHDLITIIVREESESSAEGTTDVKRDSEMEATADEFIKLNVKNVEIEQGITGTRPGIKLKGSRSFKGEGTADRRDSFIARIQAEVIDVKPNGTLVLQARKKIKNDDEEQTFVCAGVCRVEDVTPDNTVLSTQLFDLEVSKISKGAVRKSTERGVIGQLLDFLNPF